MDYSALIEVLACISAASFQIGAGTVIGFSAILIPQLESVDSDIKVNKEDVSWIASVVALVIPLGALVCGYMMDSIGRLNTVKIAAIPYVLGWTLIATANGLRTLLIGRLFTAFAIAMGGNPAFVYITEVARGDFRGALVCMATSLTSLGMLLVYAKGAFLHWRIVSWICLAYCFLPLLLMELWSPESPAWLVSKGKNQQALRSLMYLHKKDKKGRTPEQFLEELEKEHDSRKGGRIQSGSSLAKLLRALARPTGFKPFSLLSIIFLFQQFSGIYITIFYTVTFFKEMKTPLDPYLSTVGIAVVRAVMGVVTSFLLKSFGRRPLFMLSSLSMAVFMFISGYCTKQVAKGDMESSLVPIICIWLYMSVGVIGFLSIPWTMTAELFTLEVRGMAQGLMVAVAHLMMFAVLKIYPFLGDFLGGTYAVQWLFAASCLTSVAFMYVFLPETHKKTLAEIQEYFRNNTIYILSKKNPRAAVINEGEEMKQLKPSG